MIRIIIRLFRQGIQDLFLNPLSQLLTFSAVTLVIFISGLFLMALTTLNHNLSTIKGETSFQVFWKTGIDMQKVQAQWQSFPALHGFISSKTYTPRDALQRMSTQLGTRNATAGHLKHLQEANPLPPTALITFDASLTTNAIWLRETTSYLENLPGVERVSISPLKDDLSSAWRQISRYIMWPAILFLTLTLALIVGNTIRLALYSRSHEIEILQLVGAQNWYIRLPLLVSGGILCCAGAISALLILWSIHTQLYNVLNFPPLSIQILFLPPEVAIALVLVPTAVGILASYIAVRN